MYTQEQQSQTVPSSTDFLLTSNSNDPLNQHQNKAPFTSGDIYHEQNLIVDTDLGFTPQSQFNSSPSTNNSNNKFYLTSPPNTVIANTLALSGSSSSPNTFRRSSNFFVSPLSPSSLSSNTSPTSPTTVQQRSVSSKTINADDSASTLNPYLLFPGETTQHQQIFFADTEQPLFAKINSKADKGFFFTEGNWACYRRNYFQVSAAYTLTDMSNHCIPSSESTCLIISNGYKYRIQSFSICIRAQDSDDGSEIKLVQQTPKRDKGLQLIPVHQKCRVGGQISSFHSANNSPKIVTFERMQFKTSTTRRRKPSTQKQQFFNLILKLYADTEDNKQILVAEVTSMPLVVRGRSASHYVEGRKGSTASQPGFTFQESSHFSFCQNPLTYASTASFRETHTQRSMRLASCPNLRSMGTLNQTIIGSPSVVNGRSFMNISPQITLTPKSVSDLDTSAAAAAFSSLSNYSPATLTMLSSIPRLNSFASTMSEHNQSPLLKEAIMVSDFNTTLPEFDFAAHQLGKVFHDNKTAHSSPQLASARLMNIVPTTNTTTTNVTSAAGYILPSDATTVTSSSLPATTVGTPVLLQDVKDGLI